MTAAHRPQGVLPRGRRALLPRAGHLPHPDRRDRLQPEEQGARPRAAEGSGLRGRARALDHDQGVRLHVQLGRGRQAADGGRRLQGRPPGAGLGDAGAAPQQARAVGRLHDRHHVHARSRAHLEPPVQLAGLVVPRGEGAAARRAHPRERSEEAPRASSSASRPSSTRTSGRIKMGDFFTHVRHARPEGIPGRRRSCTSGTRGSRSNR